MKTVWTKEEISISDELLSLAPKLTEEFLEYHKDFHTTFSKGLSYGANNPLAVLDDNEKSKWKVEGLKYSLPEQKVEHNLFLDNQVIKNFPTAAALTKKYHQHCGCSGYSVLESGGIIKPHADIENRSRKTIRIHIPLITNPKCIWIQDGTNLHMEAGSSWIVWVQKWHQIRNDSDQDRYHLIMDAYDTKKVTQNFHYNADINELIEFHKEVRKKIDEAVITPEEYEKFEAVRQTFVTKPKHQNQNAI